jgi:hypothetical protein
MAPKKAEAEDDIDLVPLTLRLPREVHARLKQISREEYRPLNHQIILALSYFVNLREKVGAFPHPELLKRDDN